MPDVEVSDRILQATDIYQYFSRNPFEPTGDWICDFEDDLRDIWIDLRWALQDFETGDEATQSAAVYDWKFDFEVHWGRHAAEAIRALVYSLREGRNSE